MNYVLSGIIISIYIVSMTFIILVVNAFIFTAFFAEFSMAKVELNSQYECGFIPFNDSRIIFEVQFYLISLLFIVFDVEIALILPYSMVIMENGFHGFYLIYYFFFLLGLGFALEWKSGLLDLKTRNITKSTHSNDKENIGENI